PHAKLVDDALPDRGRRAGRVEHLRVEHEPALAIERVMAIPTVFPDELAVLRERRIRLPLAARDDERETRRGDDAYAQRLFPAALSSRRRHRPSRPIDARVKAASPHRASSLPPPRAPARAQRPPRSRADGRTAPASGRARNREACGPLDPS